jgi:hypothetical protein
VQRDELLDGSWLQVRATSGGEPSLEREGLVIGAGSWNGASEGAALVIGARLVARVERAGALSSDACTLGDPGFSVHALARIDGRDAPLALGRLVSLGRPRGCALARRGGIPVGSGGLDHRRRSAQRPRAPVLRLGRRARAARARARVRPSCRSVPVPYRIRVLQGIDTRDVRHLWLRVASEGAKP